MVLVNGLIAFSLTACNGGRGCAGCIILPLSDTAFSEEQQRNMSHRCWNRVWSDLMGYIQSIRYLQTKTET